MEKSERTQVVIDETTIYEIDLECLQCGESKSEKEFWPKEKRIRTVQEEK